MNLDDIINRSTGIVSAIEKLSSRQNEINKRLAGLHSFPGFSNIKSETILDRIPSIDKIVSSYGISDFRFKSIGEEFIGSMDRVNALHSEYIERFGKLADIAKTFDSRLNGMQKLLENFSVKVPNSEFLGKFQNEFTSMKDAINVIDLEVLVNNEESIDFDILSAKIKNLIASSKELSKKIPSKKINSFLCFIALLMGFHQYYDFVKKKNESFTVEEGQVLTKKVDSIINYLENSTVKFRITNRSCYLKLKPNSKSITLYNIPQGHQVNVLETRQKWVYVKYIDGTDNLTIHGWILKKYLGIN